MSVINSVGSQYGRDYTLTDGLKGYWALDGNGNDALGQTSVTNAGTWGTGMVGQCAVLAANRITFSASVIVTSAWTVACWVKPSSFAAYQCLIGNYAATPAGLGISATSGLLVFYTVGSTTHYGTLGALTVSAWNHVAVTYDGTNMRFYVNGVLTETATTGALASITFDTMALESPGYGFTGSLDEVGIWNRKLSTAEVLQHYNQGIGQAFPFATPSQLCTNMQAYWSLHGDARDNLSTYHGTPTAMTYPAGRVKSSGLFNGSTSRIDTTAVSLGNRFTLAAWVYPTSLPNAANGVFTYTGPQGMYITNLGAIETYNGTAHVSTAHTAVAGGWTHVAAVCDGVTMYHYLNGVLDVGTSAYTTPLSITTLGNDNYSQPFTGYIDEAAVWARPLTITEVKALYNDGAGMPFPGRPSVNEGLVGYYPLDGNSTNAITGVAGADTSIVYSVSYGRVGQGAWINGTLAAAKIVSATPLPVGNAARSVSFWMWQTGAPTLYATPFSWGTTAAYGNAFEILISTSNTLAVHVYGEVSGFVSFTTGMWQHVCVTYDQAIFRIYINAVQVGSWSPTTYTVNTASSSLYLGTDAHAGGQWFTGQLDEVGIWNRALSASEIQSLYDGPINKTYPMYQTSTLQRGLKGYWAMDNNATDIVNNTAATATSVTYSNVTKKIGYSAYFLTGAGPVINVGSNPTLNLPNTLTISCWVYLADITNYHMLVTRCITNGATNSAYEFRVAASGYIQFQGPGQVVATVVGMAANTWTHLCVTRDAANTVIIYANGTIYASGTVSSSTNEITTATLIGERADVSGLHLRGYIDEVGIWNRPLSQTEVTTLYNAGVGLAYPFNSL